MFQPDVNLPDDLSADPLWIVISGGRILVDESGELPLGEQPVPDVEMPWAVGTLDGRPVWGLDVPDDYEPTTEHSFVDLRSLYGRLDDEQWIVAGRAVQLSSFRLTHRFCGRCGAETEPHNTDQSKVCPSCAHVAFPRLSPAVIMLIERDHEVLLAWGRQFPGRFFSALAGFVEPGESLEQTVHREVHEEVGILVTDVTYFGSQPWPFPHSLMVGFGAQWESGEITIQEEEIVEANWYTADDLPPVPRGGMSIAGWLIEDWLARQGG
ncbi:MAG: NAD(+) diphosphatase [Acidimicrobiales bacterium]